MDDDGTDAGQVLLCEHGGRLFLRKELETVINKGSIGLEVPCRSGLRSFCNERVRGTDFASDRARFGLVKLRRALCAKLLARLNGVEKRSNEVELCFLLVRLWRAIAPSGADRELHVGNIVKTTGQSGPCGQ
jgi:hypothetical protein